MQRSLLFGFIAVLMPVFTQAASLPEEVRHSGVKGGLVVHLGCDDGRLTTALRASDAYLVQGLDADPAQVAKAREHIQSTGLYGKVSARRWEDKWLPYADNLVNLLVADELGGVPMEEIIRVLAPRGVAMIGGEKIVKPWPDEIDEWTHYLYDASGNAVSKDTRVGPPRHLQWTADPRWARSHEHAASVAAMVSGDGKLFYLHDDGITGVIVRDLPERWALYARDAFSGVLLWKKTFTDFGSSAWGGVFHCREPMSIPRRLAFGGGKVYATLGFRRMAISVLDPGTGEALASFQEGQNNDELVWHDGVLLVRQRKALPDYPLKGGSSGAVLAKMRKDGRPDIPSASMGDETVLALEASTGKVLWRREESRVVALSLAALGERVCYHNFEQIVCQDLLSGKELWRTDCPTWPDVTGTGGTLLMYDDKVVHAGSRGIQVFSRDDARIDSPPAIQRGLAMFGCADGQVYCLRATDGAPVWRFHAAPANAHCVVRGQVESRWPVHGAVLIQNDVAYFSAGRSSFLDGGIYLYALDPATGRLLHDYHLDGPWPDSCNDPSTCYAMEGAKTDVLTGDGQCVFLGFNEFDGQLNQVPGQPFTGRGSRQVHLRLMSTTGLLDNSWWDRGRWTYGCSWPGRTYSSRDPYAGQILSFDDTTVYALNAFPASHRMSPKFIPAAGGYLLTAFHNDPETVRTATDTSERKGRNPKQLLSAAVRWQHLLPIRARGMVLTKDTLFLAGAPDIVPEDDPYAALDGQRGALLWAMSTADGATRSEMKLEHPPVFDGLIAAGKCLYMSAVDGTLICLGTR